MGQESLKPEPLPDLGTSLPIPTPSLCKASGPAAFEQTTQLLISLASLPHLSKSSQEASHYNVIVLDLLKQAYQGLGNSSFSIK